MQAIVNFKKSESLTPMLQREIGNQVLRVYDALGVPDLEVDNLRYDLEEFFGGIDQEWYRTNPEGVQGIINRIIELSDLTKPGGHVPYEMILLRISDDPSKFAELLTSERENREIIKLLGITTAPKEEDYSDNNREM